MKKILPALLVFFVAVPSGAQSLRGSQASVQRMYTRAVLNDLQFLRSSKSIYESVRDGELVLIPITMDVTLEKVSYPFALPRTRDVLNVFAKKYRAACGERLVVTSAARPRTAQPRNASPQSVHPTGMAVDFRKPAGRCLSYMRGELLALEREGVLEATEERYPVHFHAAVLLRGAFAPAAPAIATAVEAPTVPALASARHSVDSAAGAIEVPEKAAKQASRTTYTVKKGDNLWVVARRFGLTVSRLRSLNGLKSSVLKPGQKLRVG